MTDLTELAIFLFGDHSPRLEAEPLTAAIIELAIKW
jgi:hypothetical protein